MEYAEQAQTTKDKEGHFCTTNKCSCVVLVVLVAALAAVVIITFFVPGLRAPVPDERDEMVWWKTSIIYQIYPRSFHDTDGDGLGDLNGIIMRMDYLKELHVGAIWISPFYKSPMKDLGYDVTNYTQVDPIFGTMADFDTLVKNAHEKGIKVIVDFVPNHTSDQSGWFQQSKNGTDDRYKDYYVWNPGYIDGSGTRQPPNNWKSVFGGSAWQLDADRQAYYYHAFLASQPDLNYSNPLVLQEMDDVISFWLNKGVDGFRLDAVPYLYEASNVSLMETSQEPFKHIRYQDATLSVIRRWKSLVQDYEERTGKTIVLIAEATDLSPEQRTKYFDAGSVPFLFDLITAKKTCGATSACYAEIIKNSTNLAEGQWPSFVTGNHDNKRISDVNGPQYIDATNMMLLTLPGTPTTYYGEELGMRGGNYTGMVPKDTSAITPGNRANSRDPERNPMQWDDTQNAGFTNGTPWLAVTSNTDYQHVNVKVESSLMSSHLSIYKSLALLRQLPAFQNAEIEFPTGATSGDVLVYIRKGQTRRFLIMINFSRARQAVRLRTSQYHGEVVIATTPGRSKTIDLSYVGLNVGEGIVVELKRN